MVTLPIRHRFTVEEYHKMGEAQILRERTELLDGEILEMSPIGLLHAACVSYLVRLFVLRLPSMADVRSQNPIILGDLSEPQPDLAIVKYRDDFYKGGHPIPQDILLLIEVSDTTLKFDREVKIPLYAVSKIPEVWIVNLPDRNIEVYRDPVAQSYTTIQQYQGGESLSISTLEGIVVSVKELFGF
ncbi:Uma2 family endonuclease [Tumidithrix helvetica PCC 7403]|uniref:Uma2 family endonuclease n=1 Tax=Tumidithrix helvetica TaxID=3457545 RepID=UPI003C947F34